MDNFTASHMQKYPRESSSRSLARLLHASKRLWNDILKSKSRSSTVGKLTNATPVSLFEVKVTLPTQLIFGEECEPSELVQIPKVRLGEGTLGTLFKVVLNSGKIITMRKIRDGLVKSDNLEFWVKYFRGIHYDWLLPMLCSFWYGGEAFVLYEYLCLGSLEELLHGSEGIQFSPLCWKGRKRIAQCTAMAVAFIHTQVTRKGNTLVCGVIKSSNILVQPDFSACLCGYEIPYLVPVATIIRRNPGRVAPEIITDNPTCPKMFTPKSDVYSFGILLLELVTGKRPMAINLAESVWENRDERGMRSISDRKMGQVNDGMVEMINIAYQCLSPNPINRPSMDRVVQMIQEVND